MKKQIILFIGLIFSYNVISQTVPYKSFPQFNGNMEAYLKYNFVNRESVYVGKTFGDMMKDMEINPIQSIFTFVLSNDKYNNTAVTICLVFQHTNPKGNYSIRDPQLYIDWEDPIPLTSVLDLDKSYPQQKWVSQYYDFYKGRKIKKIWMY